MKYFSLRNRAILREMIVTDFKIRYQGSVLGYVWSILKPLLMFVILYVVFTQVFNVGNSIKHYPVYLLMGVVLWGFFTEATSIGLGSIVNSGDIIRKISIPRYLIVFASSVSALINLGINLVVLLVFALFNGIEPHLTWLLLPVVILELFIFSQAVAFFLAALYVKFRDINYIWELVLQAGFYATPILYPLTKVPEQFRELLLLSPIAQIIQDARYVFVTDTSVTLWGLVHSRLIIVPFVVIVFMIALAIYYFKKRSHTFAEDI